jgi:hypothetical protein
MNPRKNLPKPLPPLFFAIAPISFACGRHRKGGGCSNKGWLLPVVRAARPEFQQ